MNRPTSVHFFSRNLFLFFYHNTGNLLEKSHKVRNSVRDIVLREELNSHIPVVNKAQREKLPNHGEEEEGGSEVNFPTTSRGPFGRLSTALTAALRRARGKSKGGAELSGSVGRVLQLPPLGGSHRHVATGSTG